MANDNSIFKIEPSSAPREPYPIIPDLSSTAPMPRFHWFNAFGADLSKMDLSVLGDKIEYMNFDNDTIFPSNDKLPKDFDPKKLLENGKNPGLDIRDLHKKGITGKGITVAIIDTPCNITHPEIKHNIIHYERCGFTADFGAEFHGPCVASLLCGKNTGVAPDVKLAFFAETAKPVNETEIPHIGKDGKKRYFGSYALALQKILEINKTLPDKEKISAVSISNGMLSHNQQCVDLIQQLIADGVMVLTCGDAYLFHGDIADFITADRLPYSDPDDAKSYVYGYWRDGINYKPTGILVPAGNRTTAGNSSDTNYMYWGRNGGYSWATPYMVGVYALAKQVYPNLTPLKFFEVARQTGYPMELSDGRKNILIQPKKIIEQLQNELLLQQQMNNIKQKD